MKKKKKPEPQQALPQWQDRVFDEFTRKRHEKANPYSIDNFRANKVHASILKDEGELLNFLNILKGIGGEWDYVSERGVFCSFPCLQVFHSRSAIAYEVTSEVQPVHAQTDDFYIDVYGHACWECEKYLNGYKYRYGETHPTLLSPRR